MKRLLKSFVFAFSCLITLDAKAYLQALNPESFNALYNMASKGYVSSINNARSRGLNVDAVNGNGDTGLCVAAKRRDKLAFRTFLQSGANPSHPCTWDIENYQEFMQNAIRIRPAYIDASAAQMSASSNIEWSKVGWSTAGAAAIGTAVALVAGGGGGGGGGSSDECKDGVWGTDGKCHEKIDCLHGGIQVNDYCDCSRAKGWTGTRCESPASCPGYVSTCPEGYVKSSDTCQSGYKTLYKCEPNTCEGYYATCEQGYHRVETETCQSGETILYKCEPNTCDGFSLTKCDKGYIETDVCYTPTIRYVKCDACAEGYGYYGDDVCRKTLDCGTNGHQRLDECVCNVGYKGENCDEIADYTNFNVSKNIEVTGDSGDVIGLDYVEEGDKAGDPSTLYNALSGNVSDEFEATIKVTNNGSGNTYGMRNTQGGIDPSYYDADTTGKFGRGLKSTIIVNHNGNNENSEIYGMYSSGLVYIHHSESSIVPKRSAGENYIQVENHGRGKTYGIYAREFLLSGLGWVSVLNEGLEETFGIYVEKKWRTPVWTDGQLKVEASNPSSEANVYGYYFPQGSYAVSSYNSTFPDTVVINKGKGTAYGVYGALGYFQKGLTITSNGSAIAYHIDQNLTNTGDYVDGIYQEYSPITLSSQNGDNYLLEGSEGTTINNSATVEAGIKGYDVNNLKGAVIIGQNRGIWTTHSATNAGSITADNYGIQSSGNVDNSGMITAGHRGIDAQGNTTSIINSGSIKVSGGTRNYRAGINAGGTDDDLESTVKNSGDITVICPLDSDCYGITNFLSKSEGGILYDYGNVINENGGIITVQNNEGLLAGTGIYAGGQQVENKGTITAQIGMFGSRENTITNKGGVINTSFAGMYSQGNLSNYGTINILPSEAKTVYGITGDMVIGGVEMTNEGAIQTSGDEKHETVYGIFNNFSSYREERPYVRNSGEIILSAEKKAYGINANADVSNSGSIVVNAGEEATGIYGAVNNAGGTVEVTAPIAHGIVGRINEAQIGMVRVSGTTRAYGVELSNSIVLSGTYDVSVTATEGDAYLFYVRGETLTNNTILTGGTIFGSTVINNEKASVTNINGTGIEGQAYNYGNINAKSGIKALSIALNSGTIIAEKGIIGAGQITNEEGGVIRARQIGIEAGAHSTVNNYGNIIVQDTDLGNVYGIYADKSTVNNSGSIEVMGLADQSWGIYAINGSTVTNTGSITVNGDTCSGAGCRNDGTHIYIDGYSTLNNAAQMSFTSPLNIASLGGGHINMLAGGAITAPSVSGDLGISTDVVNKGFEDTYKLPEAIISDDTTGLNLLSQSVMFDASLDGSDVIMEKKSFEDLVENTSFADVLETNYAMKNNESLYQNLKSQSNKADFEQMVKDLQADGLKRFAFEDMTINEQLNFDMNNAIFDNTKPTFTLTGNTFPLNYEENGGSNARWMVTGKKEGNLTYGAGMAFTNINSRDGSDKNSRKDEQFLMMMPMGYHAKGFELMLTPRLGYAYGHYTRDGYNGAEYDGKVEKRLYGITSAARYPINKNGWVFAPQAEFNVMGYHIKGHEEDKQYAVNIASQEVVSVEAGLGLNMNKTYQFTDKHNLKINAALMAYHEFDDPYTLKLEMKEMSGNWKIKDDKRRNNHIAVKGGLEYELEPFSIYGHLYSYIDSEYRTKADIGLKFKF